MSQSRENRVQDWLGETSLEKVMVFLISSPIPEEKNYNYSWLLKNRPGLLVILILLINSTRLQVNKVTSPGPGFFIRNVRLSEYKISENPCSSKGVILKIRDKTPRCRGRAVSKAAVFIIAIFTVTIHQKCFVTAKCNTVPQWLLMLL